MFGNIVAYAIQINRRVGNSWQWCLVGRKLSTDFGGSFLDGANTRGHKNTFEPFIPNFIPESCHSLTTDLSYSVPLLLIQIGLLSCFQFKSRFLVLRLLHFCFSW